MVSGSEFVFSPTWVRRPHHDVAVRHLYSEDANMYIGGGAVLLILIIIVIVLLLRR